MSLSVITGWTNWAPKSVGWVVLFLLPYRVFVMVRHVSYGTFVVVKRRHTLYCVRLMTAKTLYGSYTDTSCSLDFNLYTADFRHEYLNLRLQVFIRRSLLLRFWCRCFVTIHRSVNHLYTALCPRPKLCAGVLRASIYFRVLVPATRNWLTTNTPFV